MNYNKISTKKLLFFIFVFSFIIRLAFGLITYKMQGTSIWCDDWDYIEYAEHILDQGIFVPDISNLSAHSGPGFPIVIAFMFLIFGKSYIPLVILNALVSSSLCILIFYLGKELFDKNVGLFASIWGIFYVLHIRYIPRILKEVWVAFLFALIIFIFIKITKQNKITKKFILFSLLFVFLIHMDERFFVYFIIFCLGFLLLDNHSWKIGLKKVLVFFVMVIFLMIPWLIRNYHVYGRIVILTERTAWITDKYFGYTEEADKLEKEKIDKLVLYDKITKSLLEGKDVQYDIKYLGKLKKAIKLGYIPHRFNKYERWFAEFKEFWRPFRFKGGFVGHGYRFEGPSWSLKHNLSVGLTYGMLLPFFIIGIFFVLKNTNRYSIFVLCIIIIHTCIHVFLAHVRNRYRIPIDAFIIIIAFYGLQQLYWKYLDWREKHSLKKEGA